MHADPPAQCDVHPQSMLQMSTLLTIRSHLRSRNGSKASEWAIVNVQLCSRGDKRLKSSADNLTGLRQRRINRSNSDLVSFGVKEKRSPSEP